jgi:hypothetical protein
LRQPPQGRLLGDADNPGSCGAKMGGHCQKQRAGAGDHDALAADIETGFYEGLQTPRAVYAGKRPAGKGKKPLSGAGGEKERGIFDVREGIRRFDAQNLRGRRKHGLPSETRRNACQAPDPRFGFATGISGGNARAPDLAAGRRVVVDQAHMHALLGGCSGRHQASRARADHQKIEAFAHPVTTCMPGRQRIWQVRW